MLNINEPILTERERIFLKVAIKTKRDNVIYLCKIMYGEDENALANIIVATKDNLKLVAAPGMQFEGMELEIKYSLEDLGL